MTRKLVWNTIAIPAGRMLGHSAGEFTLDQKCFEDCVRNFEKDGIDVCCDWFHASESPASSPAKARGDVVASGWVKKLKIENGNLMGLVLWGDKARSQILNGEVKYLSPALRLQCKDNQTGEPIGAKLASVALCLSPFLKKLPEALALSEQDGAIQMSEVAINAAELAELSDEPEEMILLSEHTTLLAQATEAIYHRPAA